MPSAGSFSTTTPSTFSSLSVPDAREKTAARRGVVTDTASRVSFTVGIDTAICESRHSIFLPPSASWSRATTHPLGAQRIAVRVTNSTLRWYSPSLPDAYTAAWSAIFAGNLNGSDESGGTTGGANVPDSIGSPSLSNVQRASSASDDVKPKRLKSVHPPSFAGSTESGW